MQLGNRTTRTRIVYSKITWERRKLSIARARASFNPALPRSGRLMTQCRRCLIARDGVATMRELAQWCYPLERRHWHYKEVKGALLRIGARLIGRAQSVGRPGIWAMR
jgi:hypothetical protein